jgi:hypothetical protein
VPVPIVIGPADTAFLLVEIVYEVVTVISFSQKILSVPPPFAPAAAVTVDIVVTLPLESTEMTGTESTPPYVPVVTAVVDKVPVPLLIVKSPARVVVKFEIVPSVLFTLPLYVPVVMVAVPIVAVPIVAVLADRIFAVEVPDVRFPEKLAFTYVPPVNASSNRL